jgi:hypothetical protein
MSTSTHRPSSSQRAGRNPYSHDAIKKSLANFMASRNLPIPDSLNGPIGGKDCPSHSNKRQKHGGENNDIYEVCSHHPIFRFFLDIKQQVDIDHDNQPNCTDMPEHISDRPCHAKTQHLLARQLDPPEDIPREPRLLINEVNLGLKSPIDDLKKTAEFINNLIKYML